MSAATAPSPQRRRIRRLGLATAIALVVAFGVAACGGSDDDSATDTTTTSSTAAAQQGGGSSQGGGGSSGGGQSGGGSTGPTPTIVSFSTPGDIDCHNGNFQNFTASWQTTDATKVAISGGGSNLPPSGETSLGFDCSSAHTYTLTAYGSGGATATRSVTLQPRNVQQQNPDEEDE